MNLSAALRHGASALARPLQRRLARLVYPAGTGPQDFLQPPGEPALLALDSVSWQVLRNPLAMLVGGITAVLLELAEPRIRSGVWEHTRFRDEPLGRMQRTGYAAMMTAFGPRSRAQAMIARVNAGHARIAGRTPDGTPYRADDVELLTWVHATASYGFLQGYQNCVRPLAAADVDRFYAENQPAARLYGVASPPGSHAELEALFDAMLPALEPSPILHEFLAIMARLPLVPRPLRGLQSLLLRAAIANLPPAVRQRVGLDAARWRLRPWQWTLLRWIGRAADGLALADLPANLARTRLRART